MTIPTPLKNSYEMEVNRYFRRNALGIMIDNSMFYIIALGLSQYTILPYYLSKLTDSKILIGLIPTVYVLGFALPQLFIARFLIHKSRIKKYLVATAAAQRFSILAFFILTLVQNDLPAKSTIVLFFIIYAVQNLITGCWFPMWVDFVGHALPHSRGMVFGLSFLIGGLLSLAGGSLIIYLLETLPYPNAISAAAGIAFVASLISLAAILTWHETVPPVAEESRESVIINRDIFRKIRINTNFQKYLLWRGVIIGIEMSLPYLTVSALERLDVVDTQVGIFAIILSISQTILNVFWGWLGDRISYLRVVLISTLIGCVGVFLATSATSILMFYLVFVCAGAMLSGQMLASINIIYEFSGTEDIPAYAAVSQLVLSPLSGLMPLIGGLIASAFGYRIMFPIAGLFGVGGLVGLSLKVKNPIRIAAPAKSGIQNP